MANVLNYLPSKSVVLATGVASFIGYAIYFDKKRRSAPNYKEKVRENRKLKQSRKQKSKQTTEFPDPRDRQGMEQFLFTELSLGEELLNSGEPDEGAYHMANAVMCSDHPDQFLQIFQQTLPMEFFKKLVDELPAAKKRLQASLENLYGNFVSEGVKITPVPDGDTSSAENSAPFGRSIFVDDDLE